MPIDVYLSGLTTADLRDRIAMAEEWARCEGRDGINAPVSIEYWAKQRLAAAAELSSRNQPRKGKRA